MEDDRIDKIRKEIGDKPCIHKFVRYLDRHPEILDRKDLVADYKFKYHEYDVCDCQEQVILSEGDVMRFAHILFGKTGTGKQVGCCKTNGSNFRFCCECAAKSNESKCFYVRSTEQYIRLRR